jgi:hypothetical protein
MWTDIARKPAWILARPTKNLGLARESITVSVLNRAVAGLLSRSFRLVRVRGEIANFTRAASGHWYFTLKDDKAAGSLRHVPRPQPACRLCAAGRRRGRSAGAGGAVRGARRVQLTVESMQRSGLGQLYERFLQLKSRLQAEGLFDAKRPLPAFPHAIGVVTSLQAAALRDVLSTLARRSPHVAVIVYPVPVQGEGAGSRIAAMLQARFAPGRGRRRAAGSRRRFDRGPVGFQRGGGREGDPRLRGAGGRRRRPRVGCHDRRLCGRPARADADRRRGDGRPRS